MDNKAYKKLAKDLENELDLYFIEIVTFYENVQILK